MMEMFQSMDWSDTLNVHSIETIEALQERLASWEWWIVRVSVVGDNKEAFVFFFPLLAGLSISCGAKLLWAAIVVEWSNLIMKWLLRGDRPYWYVQESPLFTNATRPALRQFPNTCESGPGTPSGHLMMNVAIFYVFVQSICSLFIWNNGRILSKSSQRTVATCLWIAYSVWVSLVFLSRLYIQAHFIHQCVLGVLAGVVVGHCCWRWDGLLNLGMIRSLLLAASLFLTTGLVWAALLHWGYDPLWSVSKALRYCYDPVHVKVESQPYFIMARFTGAAMGLGLGMASVLSSLGSDGRLLHSLLACKGGVFMGRIATIALTGLPSHDVAQFLTLSMGVHAALPYAVVTTLPYALTRLLPRTAPPTKKSKTS